MTWKERYKVHPAADVFPMMSEDELAKLGEDMKANGLQSPIICQDADGSELILLDGRNRLEAMERVGLYDGEVDTVFVKGDPVSVIMSANIHRRHLSKQQQAERIVAAIEASRQVGEVPKRHVKGKAGSEKDQIKAAAVASGAKHGISKRTIERELAHYEQPTEHPNAPKVVKQQLEQD